MPDLSDPDLWRAVEHTVRQVLLPSIDDPWARSAATQLAGLAAYARSRPADRSHEHAGALRAVLDSLDRNSIVSRHWPAADDTDDGVLAATGAVLADAVWSDGPAGDEVRAVLRPLVVAQLDEQLAVTSPLVDVFRGSA